MATPHTKDAIEAFMGPREARIAELSVEIGVLQNQLAAREQERSDLQAVVEALKADRHGLFP